MRPLCHICFSLILSAAVGILLPLKIGLWVCAAALAGCTGVILAVRLGRMPMYAGCMAICLLLAFPIGYASSARYYHGSVKALEAKTGEIHTVEGVILARRWSGYLTGYTFHAEQFDGRPISVKLLLNCQYPADFQPGDSIRVKAEIASFSRDVGGFDQRRYYLAHGVVVQIYSASPDDAELLDADHSSFSFTVSAARLNGYLAERLRQILGDNAGGLLAALFLGRRDDLPTSIITSFKRLGISHLLSLSGLHLSILTGAISWLLCHFRVSRQARLIGQMGFVAGYVVLTGAPISVVRAGVMLALTTLASLIWTESDALTSLCGAVTLICLVNPASLMDIGLWMSAFATLGLLLSRRFPFARLSHPIRAAARAAVTSMLVQLMVLPFVWIANGELSLLSLFSNLVFVPLISALLYATPVVLLCGGLGGLLRVPVAGLANGLMRLMTRLVRLRGISIPLVDGRCVWLMFPLLAVALVLLFRPPKKHRCLSLLAVFLCTVFLFGGVIWLNRTDGLEIAYTAEGKNEMLILRNKAGAMLCDFTNGSAQALRKAANAASALGEAEIEAVLLTHYHTKHISAFGRLCEQWVVRSLYVPMPADVGEGEILLDLQEIAEAAGASVMLYSEGEPFHFGEATLTVYTRVWLNRSAQPLLLMHVEQGGEALTYIGASVLESRLADIAADFVADSRFLILGSHGPIPKQVILLPDSACTEQILLSDSEQLNMLNLNDLTTARLLRTCTISVVERVRLHLPIERDG